MSDAPAIIPAAFVKFSTLADGTLRIVLDVEPRDLAQAVGLFTQPGAPCAIARLTNEAATQADQPAEAPALSSAPERRQTPLASKVAMTCQSPTFQSFLRDNFSTAWEEAREKVDQTFGMGDRGSVAAQVVRDFCHVATRAEITHGSDAAGRWRNLMTNYEDWQRYHGQVA